MTEYVSARELSAHLDPIKDDIAEIKDDVKALVAHEYSNAWFGGKGQTLILMCGPVILSIIAAVIIALYIQ